MIRPSEMRVCSLIWPRRASRGSVRTVSTASVRIDLFAATTAFPAARARSKTTSDATPAPCATREANGTPLSVCFGRLRRHPGDAFRHLAFAGQPFHPRRDGRPGLLRGLRADDETEMPGADEVFVDVCVGGGALDPPHRRRLADVVNLADESQDRDIDVGERDQFAVDREAAGHHPVVGDELLEQLGDRRAAPRDPPLATPGIGAAVRAASSASRSCSCRRKSTRAFAVLSGSSI